MRSRDLRCSSPGSGGGGGPRRPPLRRWKMRTYNMYTRRAAATATITRIISRRGREETFRRYVGRRIYVVYPPPPRSAHVYIACTTPYDIYVQTVLSCKLYTCGVNNNVCIRRRYSNTDNNYDRVINYTQSIG